MRHFLQFSDFSRTELLALLQRAAEFKHNRQLNPHIALHKHLALVFEKPSTRTRVSFEVGFSQLGGRSLYLDSTSSQLGRAEPMGDMAQVLSRMVDMVAIRTKGQDKLQQFAAVSSIPVINALTDQYHPCQILADLLTWQQSQGDFLGKKVAWLGDGNNVCQSWLEAAQILGFTVHLACPQNYMPQLHQQGDHVRYFDSAEAAAEAVHVVTTDVWVSMSEKAEECQQEREVKVNALSPYQVNAKIMARAQAEAIFLHCLPAHRGEEVSAEVIDGPQSWVWQQAENRLHVQKALMEFLLSQ